MKKWYIDQVFQVDSETYDRGYYICENGTIEWFPPIYGAESEIEIFPIAECYHEDGLPIMVEDGELLGEEIHTITDTDGVEWEVKILSEDGPEIEVRPKGTTEWRDANWGVFCRHHGIDMDALA